MWICHFQRKDKMLWSHLPWMKRREHTPTRNAIDRGRHRNCRWCIYDFLLAIVLQSSGKGRSQRNVFFQIHTRLFDRRNLRPNKFKKGKEKSFKQLPEHFVNEVFLRLLVCVRSWDHVRKFKVSCCFETKWSYWLEMTLVPNDAWFGENIIGVMHDLGYFLIKKYVVNKLWRFL